MGNQIDLINDIIFNSIMHGADIGGSYDANEEGLVKSINNFAKAINIKKYSIELVDRIDDFGYYWRVLQIKLLQ